MRVHSTCVLCGLHLVCLPVPCSACALSIALCQSDSPRQDRTLPHGKNVLHHCVAQQQVGSSTCEGQVAYRCHTCCSVNDSELWRSRIVLHRQTHLCHRYVNRSSSMSISQGAYGHVDAFQVLRVADTTGMRAVCILSWETEIAPLTRKRSRNRVTRLWYAPVSTQ